MPTLSAADRPTLAQYRARAAARARAALDDMRKVPYEWKPNDQWVFDYLPEPANRTRRGRVRFQHFHPHHRTDSNRELREHAEFLRRELAAVAREPESWRWIAARLENLHMHGQVRARRFLRTLSRWTLPGCLRLLPHFPGLAGRRFLLHEVREVLPTALRVIVRRVIAPGAPSAALSAAPCV